MPSPSSPSTSCYELEAKPGTRFTHAHGAALALQAEALEGYYERVGDTDREGYRWYETANFCRDDRDRELRARHNLGIWHGADYLGVGVGAVSTLADERRRNLPSSGRYVRALAAEAHRRARSSGSTIRRARSSG